MRTFLRMQVVRNYVCGGCALVGQMGWPEDAGSTPKALRFLGQGPQHVGRHPRPAGDLTLGM